MNCGDNGQSTPVSSSICECECNNGFSGSLCEIEEVNESSLIGAQCDTNADCTSIGQICENNACECDATGGFIEDEFRPSETFGECVGPVQEGVCKLVIVI